MDTMEEESQDAGLSFKEIIGLAKEWFFYFLSNWWKIGISAAICAGIGFYIAKSKPVYYSAKLSFVVEETKTTGGGLSSLAGQLGFDFSVGAGGSLITGENLLIFLKSNSLAKDVLLTPFEEGKTVSIADKYADIYGFREVWKKSNINSSNLVFPANSPTTFTRVQDSLLQIIIDGIIKKELTIDRPEKKASFVTVEVKTKSEPLSAVYCKQLVQKAIERYIASKTKRQKTNVDRLQRRVDSIEAVLNNKTYVNASQQEQLLDLNPASKTTAVSAEVSSRDKLMLFTVYGEVVKNLELAKVQLNQETPTIQVVDGVQLPLAIVRTSKFKYFLTGAILGFGLVVGLLIIRKLVK